MLAELGNQWSKPRTFKIRLGKVETDMLNHIAQGWNREKDAAQPQGLEFDIQFAFSCSWGRALTLANAIRLTWKP